MPKEPATKSRPKELRDRLTKFADTIYKKHLETLGQTFDNIAEVDCMELRRYCMMLARIARLQEELDGNETITNGRGMPVPNPLVAVIKSFETQASVIARRLGLYLADRAVIKTRHDRSKREEPGKDPDDEFEDDDDEVELP